MSAKKGVIVEEAPKFTPEEMAAAAAQIPAVAVNAEASAAEAGTEEVSVAEKEALPAAEEPRTEPETSFALSRPVEHEGATYERVELDRARLTGEATAKAERLFLIECPRFPDTVNRLESMVFWQILGAIAAGVPYAAVKKMDLLDAWRLAGDAKELFFES